LLCGTGGPSTGEVVVDVASGQRTPPACRPQIPGWMGFFGGIGRAFSEGHASQVLVCQHNDVIQALVPEEGRASRLRAACMGASSRLADPTPVEVHLSLEALGARNMLRRNTRSTAAARGPLVRRRAPLSFKNVPLCADVGAVPGRRRRDARDRSETGGFSATRRARACCSATISQCAPS